VQFNRKQTGKSDWDEAKALVASWETANSWDGTVEAAPPPPRVSTPVPGRITIADATKVFLSNREGAKIAHATLRKYKTFTKQLTAFADSRGYLMLDQERRRRIRVHPGLAEGPAQCSGETVRRSFIRRRSF
jgi:hypothetical protein